MRLTVDTADLRQALTAVTPHAAPEKDALMHRVRLTIGRTNVEVTAGNRYAAALALVSVVELDVPDKYDDQGQPVYPVVDLTPADVKVVLTVFKGAGGTLRLEVRRAELILTDVDGLLPGQSVTIPYYGASDAFPDLAKLITRAVRRRQNLAGVTAIGTILGAPLKLAASPVHVPGDRLALFAAAAKAYGDHLTLEPPATPGGTLLVACGESFLGLIAPRKLDDPEVTKLGNYRAAWVRRLERYGDDLDDVPADMLTTLADPSDEEHGDPYSPADLGQIDEELEGQTTVDDYVEPLDGAEQYGETDHPDALRAELDDPAADNSPVADMATARQRRTRRPASKGPANPDDLGE